MIHNFKSLVCYVFLHYYFFFLKKVSLPQDLSPIVRSTRFVGVGVGGGVKN